MLILATAITTLSVPSVALISHWFSSFLKAGFIGQPCRNMRSLKKLERVSFIRFLKCFSFHAKLAFLDFSVSCYLDR